MSRKKKQHTSKKWNIPETIIFGLFGIVLSITPFVFLFKTDELFEFNKMVFIYLCTALITGAWLLRMSLERRFIFKRTYLDIPILVFLLTQILSTVLSIHPHTSFFGYYSRFHGGLLSTISYILLFYAFVSNINKRDLLPLLVMIFVGGLGISLYAIPEHFGHSLSCAIVYDWSSTTADCWKQDVQTRVFASFGQPNWLAAYALMLIPVGVVLSIIKHIPIRIRAFFATTTLALLASLIFTKSRSGFLGYGLSIVMLGAGVGILWHRLKTQFKIHFDIKWLAGIGIGMVVLIAIYGSPFSPRLSELFAAPTPQSETEQTESEPVEQPAVNRLEQGGTDSGEIRKIVWTGAINIWRRYPLFGSGLETFGYSYYLDRPLEHNYVSEWDYLYNKAHNEFLNFLATAGIIGLLAYCGVLGWFALVSTKEVAITPIKEKSEPTEGIFALNSPTTKAIIVALVSAVGGLSVSNFFGFSTVMVVTLMFVFFGILSLLKTPASLKSPLPTREPDTSQLISVFLIICLTLSSVIAISRYWYADYIYTRGKRNFDTNKEAGIRDLTQAVKIRPQEALYHDQLATKYSEIAMNFSLQNDATAAAEFANAAINASNQTIILNPNQINFYKTRAGVFIRLAEYNPEFLSSAEESLSAARILAPTDAKVSYNLGLIQLEQGKIEEGIASLEETIEMRPNYHGARWHLGQQYEALGEIDAAREQYQEVLKINPQDTRSKARLEEIGE